jgi:RimJ/RimL family protein N-acetyltransferase
MLTRQPATTGAAAPGAGQPGQPLGPEPDGEPDLDGRRRDQRAPRKPTLVGRHIQLTPLALRHYDLLYEWASREEIPWQWRGRPVSPEGLRETMWMDCLFQYVVETRQSPRPIGLVTAYGANLHHQTCYLQTGLLAPYQRRGWPFEAVALGLSVAFVRYNLRRLYAQATADTFEQFASGEGTWFEVEGRLRESVYVDGRFVDSLILTVTRERWEERIRPLVDLAERGAGPGATAEDVP